MAKRLEAGLRAMPKVSVSYAVESNAVFARIPDPLVQAMYARGWKFYTGVGGWPDSRLMCSWDTTAGDVDQFLADLRQLAAG
jgi:threonine aldolase